MMCRANIKVSSTETGAIFGNIVYESTAYADRSVVVLNDIHIDIMDYISPASCPDVQFRSMWAEFEWENKVGHSFACVDDYRYLCPACRNEKKKKKYLEKLC
jgi:coatomer subunit beta